MIVAKNNVKTTDFKLSINHNLINLKNKVKYLGVYLLIWKAHIDYLSKKNSLRSVV